MNRNSIFRVTLIDCYRWFIRLVCDVYKLMDSVASAGEETRLLQLSVWFEGRYEKDAMVTIQVGLRAPLIHSHYLPMTKVYFYDVATPNSLPTIRINYKNIFLPLPLQQHAPQIDNKIHTEEFTAHFVYELLASTHPLYEKYCCLKEPEDKFARGEGLSNFVRAESEFLALFDRHQDIEQIRAAEAEEGKIEKELSEDIIKLQKTRIDLKVIIVLCLLFLAVGYFARVLHRTTILNPPRAPRSRKRPSRA